jgi:RNA polymerase sigma-70 factor (ECF subfamily)
MTMSGSDGELVAQALRGRTEAFASLVERYLGAAHAVAIARTGNYHDAEDVTQDAFIIALERLAECREPDRFGGWLLEIVRNRALNLTRARTVRAVEPLDEAGGMAASQDPDLDARRATLRGELVAALEDLTPVQREVLLLHDLEGWRHAEIADRLGLAEGTARFHLHHARREMRERLAPRYAENG